MLPRKSLTRFLSLPVDFPSKSTKIKKYTDAENAFQFLMPGIQTGLVNIHVSHASNVAKDENKKFFVKMFCGQKEERTHARDHSDLVWEQSFQVEIDRQLEYMTFELYSRDYLGNEKLVSYYVVCMSRLESNYENSLEMTLRGDDQKSTLHVLVEPHFRSVFRRVRLLIIELEKIGSKPEELIADVREYQRQNQELIIIISRKDGDIKELKRRVDSAEAQAIEALLKYNQLLEQWSEMNKKLIFINTVIRCTSGVSSRLARVRDDLVEDNANWTSQMTAHIKSKQLTYSVMDIELMCPEGLRSPPGDDNESIPVDISLSARSSTSDVYTLTNGTTSFEDRKDNSASDSTGKASSSESQSSEESSDVAYDKEKSASSEAPAVDCLAGSLERSDSVAGTMTAAERRATIGAVSLEKNPSIESSTDEDRPRISVPDISSPTHVRPSWLHLESSSSWSDSEMSTSKDSHDRTSKSSDKDHTAPIVEEPPEPEADQGSITVAEPISIQIPDDSSLCQSLSGMMAGGGDFSATLTTVEEEEKSVYDQDGEQVGYTHNKRTTTTVYAKDS